METVFADRTVSVSEFKMSPVKKLSEAQGRPVAVLVNNKPSFYAVPSDLFERIADVMDDLLLADTVRERMKRGRFVEVSLDDL